MPAWQQYEAALRWEPEARPIAKELQELNSEAEAKISGTADKSHFLSEWNVNSQDLDINKEMTSDVVVPEVWKDASRRSWKDEEGNRLMSKGLRGVKIDAKEESRQTNITSGVTLSTRQQP